MKMNNIKMAKQLSNAKNLRVLYEDNHLIIVNKRSGDIVQGDKTGDKPLSEIVKTYIKHKTKKEGNVFLGVVHRIDRPTTGIVLFAKSSKALSRLNEMFAKRELKKSYLAIVENRVDLESQELVHYLKKNPKNNKSTVYIRPGDGAKKAILTYKTLASTARSSILSIDLQTGRHHQIRSQLSAIKHPIIGDLKYGAEQANKGGFIYLHAHKLSFIHPVSKKDIKVTAKPNFKEKLWEVFKQYT